MFYFDRSRLTGATAPDWSVRFAELQAQARHPALRSFYAAGAPGPETPLKAVPLAALDFETTGLDPHTHSIVSIGLAPFDLGRIRCRQARHWVIKPRKVLTSKSVTIHGITHSEIEQAPDLSLVLEDLLQAMRGRVFVAHHGAIERDFLALALQARIGEGIEFPLIDTMALETRFHPRRQSGWWGRLLGREPVSIRLAQSRERYHLPHYRPHHALTDALACAELLQAQVAHRLTPEMPVGEVWS